MRILDQITGAEAATGGLLAAANACHFGVYARRRPSRRVAAATLVLVNAALAAEAALYLALLPRTSGPLEEAGSLLARTLALLAVATISALVLRGNAVRPRSEP